MAESFTNSITRAAGIVTSKTLATIGVRATTISGVSTVGVNVGDIVVNQHYFGGTKVSGLGVGQVTVDKQSTNTAIASSQSVKFLGPTTAFTSSSEKSILIGGTFANLTPNQTNLFVELFQDSSGAVSLIANEIPIPQGSSFVISDAGKTVMGIGDSIRVYSDTADSLDVTLGILRGVS